MTAMTATERMRKWRSECIWCVGCKRYFRPRHGLQKLCSNKCKTQKAYRNRKRKLRNTFVTA